MSSKKPSTPRAAQSTMRRCNYFMPAKMVEGLEVVAAKTGVSVAEVVRQSVQAKLRRHGIYV